MLVDSHVNLHHEKFAGEVDAVIDAALAAGVKAMLTISDKISSTAAIKAISSRYDFIWRSVGAHPHYASDHLDLTADMLVALAADDDVVGIGECGLDFHYGFSPRADQEQVFAAHLIGGKIDLFHALEEQRGAQAIQPDPYLHEAIETNVPPGAIRDGTQQVASQG